jgi:hypothetical protein
MTGLFAAIGAGLGLAFGLSYRASDSARAGPTFLERELARPLATLLHAGEGEQVEFKASARWDAKQGRMNKDLEEAVAKTIAGFLNILVEPSPRPVYCRDAAVARYFLRTGNGTRELDVREAMEHAAQRWPARRGRAPREAGDQGGSS